MVLVKISNFFIFSLWENRLRRVFGDVLGRILQKKSQYLHFSKGVSPYGFRQKY